jgi:hypothetical protein
MAEAAIKRYTTRKSNGVALTHTSSNNIIVKNEN